MRLLAWRENPVFQREMLTRWRHPISFVLVVAYAFVITGAVGWQMWVAPAGQSESELGHSIWQTLTITQTFGWMVLGPVLAAASLAGEREKGHLQALFLSPLTSREIASGKMNGALSLVVLLLLVPLPAIALCFLLGGVSPEEFLASLVINFATALSGLSFGMVASAQSRDTGQAIFKALGRALWAYILMVLPCCFPFFNPAVASSILTDADGAETGWLLLGSFVFLLVHLAITQRQLNHAVREVVKPLPESSVSPELHWPQWDSATIEQTYQQSNSSNPANAGRSERLRVPFWMRLLHFANPVLQREARRAVQFKWSTQSGTNDAILGLAVLVFAGYVLPLSLMAWSLLHKYDAQKDMAIWWMVSYPWLISSTILAALSAASSFTREREGGHWPLLWLTPLQRGEIIGGKLSGVLFGIAYYSLWLLPFWIPCCLILPPTLTISTFWITLSSIWLAANIGLFFSALCKKTGTAFNWTILAFLAWWLLHPPWTNWKAIALSDALGQGALLLVLGELLYLGTHRILHRAPYER
jgi:ABC-type transport system involved in multi-copper enzyme maturation permease subunit